MPRMKKLLSISVALLLFNNLLIAQYQIKIKATGVQDSVAYFRGSVFDEKNFVPKDTIPLYKGTYTIKYAKPIIGGLYYFYFPKSKQVIQFILESKDTLQFEIRGKQYLDSITTNKSKNKSLIEYQRLENKLASIDSLYANEVKQGKKFNLVQKASFFKNKTDQLVSFRLNAIKQLKPNDALSIYFKALNTLDSSLPNIQNYAARNTFLQQINITTPKLLFTPALKNVLLEYLSYYPKHADSLCIGIDSIMARFDCKNKAYLHIFETFSKLLKNRTVPNNTEGYTYFIEKYVQNATCKFLKPEAEKKILEEVAIVKAIKLNDTCLNIILPDTLGVNQNLHEIAKGFNYTVLIFYDPNCEHCKVEVPKMDSVINLLEKQFKLKLGRFAICNAPSTLNSDWKIFIADHQLNKGYTHVKMGSDFSIRTSYDAWTNPIFFLIDKESKMLAKKISAATLRKIMLTQLQFKK